MNDRQKRIKRYGWLVPGIILAVLAELFLAGCSVLHGYGGTEGKRTVLPAQIYDYNQEGGRYHVSGPAPNMELEVGKDAGYVELFFAEPLNYDMELYGYYTERENQGFNQYERIDRFLIKGTTRAKLYLPKKHLGRIRLDISGDFVLNRIETGDWLTLSDLNDKSAAVLLRQIEIGRLLMMAALFGCAGFFLMEKKREGSTDKGSRAGEGAKAGGVDRIGENTKAKDVPGEKLKTSSGRTVYLDAARTVAALFVIMLHLVEPVAVLQEPGTLRSGVFNGTSLFLLTCNLMFFFISGALLLPGKEESVGTFYKKRLWKIALPFAIYACFYLRGMCASEMGILPWLPQAVSALFGAAVITAPHFWMIYELLGVYLLAPFFRYMVRAMGEKTEKWLFALIILSLLLRTGQLYLGRNFAVGTILDSWPGIFLGGYLLNRAWMRRYDGLIVGAGAASFACAVWLSFVRTDFKDIACNRSILMFCMTAALFVVLLRGERHLRRIAPALTQFSKYSYSILLVHWFVMSAILSNGMIPEKIYARSSFQILFSIVFVTVGAFVIAWITDHIVVFTVQEGLERLGKRLICLGKWMKKQLLF